MNKIENMKEILRLRLNSNKKEMVEDYKIASDDRMVQKDYKLKTMLIFSEYAYLALLMASIVLAKVVGVSVIVNAISPFYIPLIIGGASLGIGALCNILKNFIIGRNTDDYDNLNSELGNLTNELYSKYEIDKIKNENKVIELVNSSLDNGRNIFSNKGIDSIEEISSNLNIKYDELKNLTKQKYILKLKAKNNFILSILKAITTVISSVVILNLAYLIPLLVVNYGTFVIPTNLTLLPVLIIGGLSLGSGVYSLYRSKLNNNAVKKLSYILSDKYQHSFYNGDYEVLDLEINYKSLNKISKAIESKIKDISNLELELLNRKQQIKEQQQREIHNKLVKDRAIRKQIAPRGDINVAVSSKTKKRVINGYQIGYKFN